MTLTHKFILGSLAVGAAVVALPPILARSGIAVAPWIAPFVALGVGGAIGFFLSRDLTRTFRDLHGATERISRGELSVPVAIPRSRFPDETDDLARAVAAMVASLRELAQHVKDTSEQVSTAAHELTSSAQHVTAHNEEVSGTVSNLARNVSEQQELLESAHRRVHQIANTIELNASRAREAFGFAAEANQKANSGADVTRLAIEKMRTVFERVEQAVARVFELEAKIRHVHQITEIITSVAHRTNLLSLNASIEAARAGEAGRGFSVVADEIRKLAESAGRSGEEISKLIHEIQTDASEVADEMRSSSQVIGEGREDVDTLAHSLGHIRAAVSEAAARAEEIFHGADDHSRDVEQMVRSMDELAKVGEKNGAALDGVVANARGQTQAMTEVVASSRSLTELAEELRAVLRRFDTQGSRGATP